MQKKIYLVLILVFEVLLLIAGCAKKPSDTPKIINDGINTVESLYDIIDPIPIYIEENGEYVPFLVISTDYNDGVLLLRKEVLPTPMQYNDYWSAYEGSTIDSYLNEGYIEALTDDNLKVKDTEIIVTAPESIGVCGDATNTIVRGVFLLSITELGYDDSLGTTHEGEALEFFSNLSNRNTTLNGKPSSWWTRSAETYHGSAVHAICLNGGLGNGNASDLNGIRPAFCISKGTTIEQRQDLIPGESIYIIASNQ